MARTERLSNLGWGAMKAQTTTGSDSAVIPNVGIAVYDESLTTSLNLNSDNPVMATKAAVYQTIRGMRTHAGSITVLAEPNTAAHFYNANAHKTGSSGTNPTTHSFAYDSTNPISYTFDFLKGGHVFRFWNVQFKKISPAWDGNKMQFKLEATALNSFIDRNVASATGSGPSTVTLSTTYDPKPNQGLVVGDVVQFLDVSASATTPTYVNGTVTAVNANGTDFTVTEDWSTVAANDVVSLRTRTITYALLEPYQWARTEFRFADTAANALTAAHLPLETGSQWDIDHKILPDTGPQRSGSYDPASLPRGQTSVSLKIKAFFDDTQKINYMDQITKRACVVRCFSGTNHELRYTLNHITAQQGLPSLNTGNLLMEDIDYVAEQDATDGQQVDVKVINELASI